MGKKKEKKKDFCVFKALLEKGSKCCDLFLGAELKIGQNREKCAGCGKTRRKGKGWEGGKISQWEPRGGGEGRAGFLGIFRDLVDFRV